MADQKQLQAIQQQITSLQDRIASEGITDSSGKVLVAPTKGKGSSTPIGANSSSSSGNTLLDTLTKRLLSSEAISSSTTSEIDSRINQAISGVQEAKQANQARIESQYGRYIDTAQRQQQNQITGFREGETGYATSMVALRELVRTTDENVKDLQQRKEELILQGNAEAATQISNLQLQQLQFKQQAQQQAFSNLLGIGNLATSIQQNQRLQEQQDFTQMMQRINFLGENDLLKNLSPDAQATMEQQFNLPAGSLADLSNKKDLNLQNVSGVGLVNITRDKNGNIQSEVIVRAKETNTLGLGQQEAYRSSSAAQYLNSLVGEDGYVAPETYVSAKNNYINSGGTLEGFKREFPPQLYLSTGSMDYVPESLRFDPLLELF